MKENKTGLKDLNLLREINYLSKKYYGEDSKRTVYEYDLYLEGCNEALFNYFKEALENAFLFSALSYIIHTNAKGRISLVKGSDAETNYNFNSEELIKGFDEFKNELNVALQKVISGELVSMTNILLDKGNTHDLFLLAEGESYCDITNKENPKASIIELVLGKIVFIDDFQLFYENSVNKKLINELYEQLRIYSGFFNYTTQMIADYVWHYKKISNAYTSHNNQPFYIHFIRPSIIDDKYGFNLLLSIATNRCLSAQELAIIDLFIYRIVSQMFIEKVKDAEHQNLLILRSGMGHFLKNRVSQKGNYVSKIENENRSQNLRIEENCNKLKATFTSLINIGSLFHIISSISKNNSKSVLGTDLSIEKNWVQKTDLKIAEIVKELQEIIYESKKSMALSVNIIDENLILEKIGIRPYINKNKYLPASWIYREIFFELFYNAGKYAISSNDVFDIEIECSENCKMLILSNSIKDDRILSNERYSKCINRFGRIQNHNLHELTGLAFVDEFLEISKLGRLYARVMAKQLKFSIGLELEGFYKI